MLLIYNTLISSFTNGQMMYYAEQINDVKGQQGYSSEVYIITFFNQNETMHFLLSYKDDYSLPL